MGCEWKRLQVEASALAIAKARKCGTQERNNREANSTEPVQVKVEQVETEAKLDAPVRRNDPRNGRQNRWETRRMMLRNTQACLSTRAAKRGLEWQRTVD